MKKTLTVFLIGLFIGAGVVPSISSDVSSFGETIYVDDDNTGGPWDGTPTTGTVQIPFF